MGLRFAEGAAWSPAAALPPRIFETMPRVTRRTVLTAGVAAAGVAAPDAPATKRVVSCLTLAAAVEGKRVQTIEALAGARRHTASHATGAHRAVLTHYPAIAQSLQLAASAQLRNMATLGGNVLQKTRCPYYRDPRLPWLHWMRRSISPGHAARARSRSRLVGSTGAEGGVSMSDPLGAPVRR